MGCDIHLIVQALPPIPSSGGETLSLWVTVVPTPDTLEALGIPPEGFDLERLDEVYFTERNYAFFGALAGVRGTPDVAPLSQRRGLPADFVRRPPPDDDFHPVNDPHTNVTHNVWMGEYDHGHATLLELAYFSWHPDIRPTVKALIERCATAARRVFPDQSLPYDRIRIVFGFEG